MVVVDVVGGVGANAALQPGKRRVKKKGRNKGDKGQWNGANNAAAAAAA